MESAKILYIISQVQSYYDGIWRVFQKFRESVIYEKAMYKCFLKLHQNKLIFQVYLIQFEVSLCHWLSINDWDQVDRYVFTYSFNVGKYRNDALMVFPHIFHLVS